MLIRAFQPTTVSLAGRRDSRRADTKALARLHRYHHQRESSYKVIKKEEMEAELEAWHLEVGRGKALDQYSLDDLDSNKLLHICRWATVVLGADVQYSIGVVSIS